MVDSLIDSHRFLICSGIFFAGKPYLDSAKTAAVSVTVSSEESNLESLKGMLGTQGTLRPIFEPQLRQKRVVRERAMAIRKKVRFLI